MKRGIITGFLLLLVGYLSAQSISGTVTDSQTGEPLPGATVFLVNQSKGTVTNSKGYYSIEVSQAGILKVKASFLGYEIQSKEYKIEEVTRKGVTRRGKSIQEVEVRVPAPLAGHVSFELQPVNYQKDEIVVTGTQVATSRSNLPLTTSVVGATQIEQSAELNLLPVLSQNVPGLFVTQRGYTGFGISDGAAGKLSIRGVGSADQSQLLIMIDGQPQFMGIFGHGFPDMYQSSDIERAEIIRGPASVLYGTNAMGGVINLITRKNRQEGFSAALSGQYGSFSTLRGNLSLGFHRSGFSVWGSFNHDQTSGHRPSSDFRGDNGHAGFELQLGSHFALRLTTFLSNFHSVDPGPEADSILYADNSHWADVTRLNTMLTVKNSFEKVEGHLNAFYNLGDHSIYTNWISTDRNYGISLFEGLKLFKDNLWGLGIDWNQYGGQGNTVEPFDNWQQVYETGFYTFMQQEIAGRLTLNGGLRYQLHSEYGGRFIPQAGLTYRLNQNNELKVVVSKGYRSPNVKELYFFPPANPDLLPESLWNYEAGYTRYGLNRKFRTSVNLFYMTGDNLIMTVPNPDASYPPMKNMNSGSFTHTGGELEVEYRIWPGLGVNASYAYLYMDTPKIAAPKHQVQAGLSFAWGRFDGSLSVQGINGLYTRVDNSKTMEVDETSIENYFLAAGRLNFKVTSRLSCFILGNNLTNSRYEINYDYPMPGISGMIGLKFQID